MTDREGWRCPSCQKVYAPQVTWCQPCSPKRGEFTKILPEIGSKRWIEAEAETETKER